MIAQKEIRTLEFDKILNILAGYAYSSPGRQQVLSISPVCDFEEARLLLEYTSQADRTMYEFCCTPSFAIDDITEHIAALEKQATLSCKALLQVAKVLNTAKNFKLSISKLPQGECPLIAEMAASIYVNSSLEKSVTDAVLNENELADGASSKLYSIRQAIRRTNEKIRQKLNSYISGGFSKYLQDNIITVRGDRYVIPVKSECQGQIPGLVHDRSATGATVFIEPLAIVELNNELRGLLSDEQNEIAAILQALSFALSQEVSGIQNSFDTIAKADCIFAKARYARDTKAVAPVLNDKGVIRIFKGRHPLINASKVVPIDVRLGDDFKVLLITGPNTGGKTVTLKLVGLFTLMACSGMFVPCEESSELAVFDGVYCDIGDEQSIEQSLSTFSSHMTNLIRITSLADNNSLVLLDELGAGTDPAEGSALAIAVIEYLLNNDCRCITTTHYNELKEYSYTAKGVSNASMDFDPETFAPVYKLLIGVSGSSNAIKIAQKLGLSEKIISRAKECLSQDKIGFDNVIAFAEKSRREAEEYKATAKREQEESARKLQQVNTLVQQLEEKQAKLDEKLAKSSKQLLSDVEEEADEIIDELKELLKKGDEQSLFKAYGLKKKISDLGYKQKSRDDDKERYSKIDGEIKSGDDVYVKKLKMTARVLSVDSKRKRYEISAGNLTTTIKFDEAQKIRIDNEKKQVKAHVTPSLAQVCPRELNVIGQTVDEAEYNIDSYISQALFSGLKEVRIVHGKGSGALRSGLHRYFSSNKHIESFRLGKYGEGEDGVTILTLK